MRIQTDAAYPEERQTMRENFYEYTAWCQAKSRCNCKTNKSYPDYGGRGIRFCEEWSQDFNAFFSHVGPRPSALYSLDRIDNDGDYEPGNVKWSLRHEQARNKRCTKLTPVKATEIRDLRRLGYSFGAIGKRYGVTRNVIWRICIGKIWKEVGNMCPD